LARVRQSASSGDQSWWPTSKSVGEAEAIGATHLRPVALAGKYGENAWIARPVAWLDDHTPREREVGKLQLVDLGQRRNMLDDYLMLIEHGDPP